MLLASTCPNPTLPTIPTLLTLPYFPPDIPTDPQFLNVCVMHGRIASFVDPKNMELPSSLIKLVGRFDASHVVLVSIGGESFSNK